MARYTKAQQRFITNAPDEFKAEAEQMIDELRERSGVRMMDMLITIVITACILFALEIGKTLLFR